MKIMLVTRVYPTHRAGGMPFVVQDRARALSALGHDVKVVTTACLGSSREWNDSGPTVHHLEHTAPMKWSPEFAKDCREVADYFKPDIIHLDSFHRDQMWYVGNKARTVVTCHGFGWGAFLTRWNMMKAGQPWVGGTAFNWADLDKEAKALSKVDVVIGVSRHEHRMLRDEYGLENAKLVYNPIPDYFFEPMPSLKSNGRYFICAAVSGQHQRGFDVVEKACRIAGVHLQKCERLDRRQMVEQYDNAIALLLPTAYAQGYDLAVAEARARGVGAIMSATGSYLSEAEDFDRHCKPLNVDSLVAQIKAWVQPSRSLVRAAAQVHRAEWHAQKWLEAVMG